MVVLVWTAGANNGAPVQEWQYRRAIDRIGIWTEWAPVPVGIDSRRYVLKGLTNGVRYLIQLRAVNAVGNGEETDPVLAQPLGVGRVISLEAIPKDGSVLLVWKKDDNLQSSVTKWQYQQSEGEALIDSGVWTDIHESQGKSYLVEHLANGMSYRFQVRAANDFATGEPSVSVVATPRTIPDAPQLRVIPRINNVLLEWIAGWDGGSSVKKGRYRQSTDGERIELQTWQDIMPPASRENYVVVALVGYRWYTFQLRALKRGR